MGPSFILGMFVAFACVIAGFCVIVPLLLFRSIGECQAEAEAENTLFPGAPTARRISDSTRQ